MLLGFYRRLPCTFIIFFSYSIYAANYAATYAATAKTAQQNNPHGTRGELQTMNVLPPRIVQYSLFSGDMDSFSIYVQNTVPLDNVEVRIFFPKIPDNKAEFFTNNIRWKRIGQYYYLTNIYGKPAEVPIVENFFKLEVHYRFKPLKYTIGVMEIVQKERVLKSIPMDFIPPLQLDYYAENIINKIKEGKKEKIGAAIIGLFILWLLYEFLIRRPRKNKIPLCSTRARFSTLIEENQKINIEETKNPFGCRLGGLKKRLKIEYRDSKIFINLSGKRSVFSDHDSISLEINQYWKLKMEAQNYFGNDEKSHKNLVVLLLPS